jgi:hypothetical protein
MNDRSNRATHGRATPPAEPPHESRIYVAQQGRFALPAGDRGQAMIEFVLVFPVMLVLIMGIIEMSQLSVAHQVVNYASFCAARSAIVNGAFDRAAILASMTLSPSGNMKGSSLTGNIINQVSHLRIKNAVARFKNSWWQTYVWIDCYDKNNSFIRQLSLNQHAINSPAPTLPANTAYVKAGVLYLYPLKFPVIGTLVNLAARHVSTTPGGDTRDIFGTAPDPGASGIPYDQWAQADAATKALGGTYVPIVKWCYMGLN